ncbi:MAG: hypothetical protein JWM57_559 [Phycisphaerales bacterium]|nr:hypothetical protein [Phycisphaerales bacterium]
MRLAPLLLVVALAASARADKLIIQGTGPQTVTVTGFANGRLQYQNERGGTGDREYARVQQLVIDAEPALSAAEASLVAGQNDVAIENYTKAVRGSTMPWVKVFAARRLLDAAGPNGKFEPRLTAYLALLQLSPADAAGRQPALPEAGSQLLNVAVLEVESALKAPKVTDPAKVALLNFLTDIHRRRGDDAAVAATIERLAKSSPSAGNDPAVQAQLTAQKLGQAKAAADAKDFAAAVRLIDQNRASIVDPAQQSDALFILARAKQANADASDTAAQQDAAVAFMRVVAGAKDLPGRPNVLASLRATAAILERIGSPADAVKIYQQIAREFAEDPAAVTEAQADVRRLSK